MIDEIFSALGVTLRDKFPTFKFFSYGINFILVLLLFIYMLVEGIGLLIIIPLIWGIICWVEMKEALSRIKTHQQLCKGIITYDSWRYLCGKHIRMTKGSSVVEGIFSGFKGWDYPESSIFSEPTRPLWCIKDKFNKKHYLSPDDGWDIELIE